MHNTVGIDIYTIVTGVALTGLLGWFVFDSIKRGRMSMKYGGMLYRKKQPIGFWAMVCLSSAFTVLALSSIFLSLKDLIVR